MRKIDYFVASAIALGLAIGGSTSALAFHPPHHPDGSGVTATPGTFGAESSGTAPDFRRGKSPVGRQPVRAASNAASTSGENSTNRTSTTCSTSTDRTPATAWRAASSTGQP